MVGVDVRKLDVYQQQNLQHRTQLIHQLRQSSIDYFRTDSLAFIGYYSINMELRRRTIISVAFL